MMRKMSKQINVFAFGCEAPLRFFEHCASCVRFGQNCPDLSLGKEVLRGKRAIDYGHDKAEDTVPVSAFNCLAPVYYFEQSRQKCGHAGRCREEGLLLALLDGKKALDYSHKEITTLPRIRRRREVTRKVAEPSHKAVAS